MSTTINIKEVVHKSLSSRKDGRKLRRHLEKLWDENDRLEIDFSGMEIASVSFLDEAFGALLDNHSLDEMKGKLSFINIEDEDRKLLNYIILSRKKKLERTGY